MRRHSYTRPPLAARNSKFQFQTFLAEGAFLVQGAQAVPTNIYAPIGTLH